MSYIKAIAFFLLCCSAVSAAAAQEAPSLPWTMSVAGAQEPLAATGATRIVVFRLARAGANATPLKIYINNDYHSTLLPEKRTWIANVCPGINSINIVPEGEEASSGHKVYRNLKAGDAAFYQIDAEDNGIIQGRFVNEDQARDLVSSLHIQAHTLSRVAAHTHCPAEVFFLDATTLFRFGKSDYAGIKKEGRQVVEELSRQLKDKYPSLSKIVVNGYSDPVGDASYNLHLSRQRAETVARLLTDNGIDNSLIIKNGFGAEKLLVADCDRQYHKRADIISCNQPNRRVSLEVYDSPNIESKK
ncbi:OmpA family protein [Kalamiella sp. sgz302252]|uniref:OmpA family protein n=1 Tax=Pantoea sp. sgz302252 TaxID=3341827 RepID=UPI0036D39B69